jgi:hypothetical protein
METLLWEQGRIYCEHATSSTGKHVLDIQCSYRFPRFPYKGYGFYGEELFRE